MIQVRGLTKYYGERAAIRNLDFDIADGEVVGFLGLNGAGKSTTLKILGCVLLPTSGRVTVDGIDVVEQAHEVRAKIGFLPDTPPLYNDMTVGDYLAFAAQLRGVPAADVARKVAAAEDKTDLHPVHDDLISSLSHGYRQRVGLAQALVHSPSLLILDEPTSGLDPVQIVEMRGLIKRLRGQHTLLISSHILSEISQTCDRLVVIQRGQIAFQGREDELAAQIERAQEVDLTLRATETAARAALSGVAGVVSVAKAAETRTGVSDGAGEVTLRVRTDGDRRGDLVRAAVAAGLDVLQLGRSSSRLESMFLSMTHTPAGKAPSDPVRSDPAGAAAPGGAS